MPWNIVRIIEIVPVISPSQPLRENSNVPSYAREVPGHFIINVYKKVGHILNNGEAHQRNASFNKILPNLLP